MSSSQNEFSSQQELKNSIFAAKAAAEQADKTNREAALSNPNLDPETKAAILAGAPIQSREDYVKKDLNYDIPVESVSLPSLGLIYPPEHPLAGVQEVDIRAMTAKEEDILMNQTYIRKGVMVNELIRSCLLDKRIDPSTLLSGDQTALMYKVRSLGYGNIYEPKHKCPQCETQTKLEIDLDAITIKTLDIAPITQGVNEFEFVLPVTKKRVRFKFLNSQETKAIVDDVESKRKKGIVNSNLITARLMANIISVDGETNRTKISQFAQFMPAKDSLALRRYVDDHEPNVESKVPFKCTNCGHEQDIVMPLTADFFWPNVDV